MKSVFLLAGALATAGLVAAGALAQSASPGSTSVSFPEWAYPVNPPLSQFDASVPRRLPDSDRSYTQAQIENDFAPPDWFPEDHPPMPAVVANGRPPAVGRHRATTARHDKTLRIHLQIRSASQL